jgi:hypothetical protein
VEALQEILTMSFPEKKLKYQYNLRYVMKHTGALRSEL